VLVVLVVPAARAVLVQLVVLLVLL